MTLDDSQKETVSGWVNEGKSIADVQRLLLEEFSVSMTYMDVRFLIDDLGVHMEEASDEESEDTTETVEEPEVVDEGLGNSVSIEVDGVNPPGSLMSGSVTFSDRETLKWQLLANGQLGLIPGDNADYRPSPEDMQDFRAQMDDVVRSKGLGF